MNYRVLLLSVFTLFMNTTFSQIIGKIEFEGNKKTKSDYLLNIIKSKSGENYSKEIAERDAQNLRNLGLFFDVHLETSILENVADLKFTVRESVSLVPIISLGRIKENYRIKLGALDNNFLGRGKLIGGFYEYYDRHSFEAFYRDFRIKGSKFGQSIVFKKHSTLEPLYFGSSKSLFNYDYYFGELLATYSPNLYNRIELGGGLLKETYEKTDTITLGKSFDAPVDLTKHLYKVAYHYNKVDYYYEQQHGLKASAFVERIYTKELPENNNFYKFFLTTSAFLTTGEKSFLAFRANYGISTNNDSPFAPFVLDSYMNIRGSGNRVKRGSGEIVLNSEFRQTILSNEKKYSLQLVGFTDIGTWRTPGGSFSSFNDSDYWHAFYGGGFRFNLQTFYQATFRLDFGKSFEDKTNGIVLSMNQHF